MPARLTKQRKSEQRETRKPHDIITSPDHAHDPTGSCKTADIHTDCKSCDTHTRTHTLSVKHNLTLNKTSAFDISQNPHVLAVPKPKRHLWQKGLIFILIMLFPNSSWTVLWFSAVGTGWFGSTAANIKLINFAKRTDRQTTKQADWQACSKPDDDQSQQ